MLDLVGLRYGNWTVLAEAGRCPPGSKNPKGQRRLLCVCDCGVQKDVAYGPLTRGDSKSCGCLRRYVSSTINKTHGKTKTPEYRIWAGIKTRCFNQADSTYLRYGARGISMCRRWAESFDAFFADMGPRPDPALSIERLDNDGDYEPGNCVWASDLEQANNRRSTVRYPFNGEMKTAREIATATGLGFEFLRHRLQRGMPVERPYPSLAGIKGAGGISLVTSNGHEAAPRPQAQGLRRSETQ
jgi:hypothetical protein